MITRMKGVAVLALSLTLMGGLCMPAAQAAMDIKDTPKEGVSAVYFEQQTGLGIVRLQSTPDGGVCVTNAAGFLPDEVLTIDQNNQPQLMMADRNGNLVPHPTRVAGVHGEDIIIMDKSVRLSELADNPMPTITYDEGATVYSARGVCPETPVSLVMVGSNPVTAADFERSLPVVARMTTMEREVALSTCPVSSPCGPFRSCPAVTTSSYVVLPGGWREVSVGKGNLILDKRGVIRDIIP